MTNGKRVYTRRPGGGLSRHYSTSGISIYDEFSKMRWPLYLFLSQIRASNNLGVGFIGK